MNSTTPRNYTRYVLITDGITHSTTTTNKATAIRDANAYVYGWETNAPARTSSHTVTVATVATGKIVFTETVPATSLPVPAPETASVPLVGPRTHMGTYRMRTSDTYVGDTVRNHTRVINGTSYDFTRIQWGNGDTTFRVFLANTPTLVHEWTIDASPLLSDTISTPISTPISAPMEPGHTIDDRPLRIAPANTACGLPCCETDQPAIHILTRSLPVSPANIPLCAFHSPYDVTEADRAVQHVS